MASAPTQRGPTWWFFPILSVLRFIGSGMNITFVLHHTIGICNQIALPHYIILPNLPPG
jgi:hypothetical protein